MKELSILMKYFVIILCLSSTLILCDDNNNTNQSKEEDNGIIILTDENFEETVNKYEFMLIEFYAPWCMHCQEFEPIYKQIAQKLKSQNSVMRLAKIDGTTNTKTADSMNIEGFPTLLLHYKDIYVEFGGLNEEADVLEYINKVLTNPYNVYTNINDINKHCENYTRIMISTFTDDHKDEIDIIKKAAIANPFLEWINCNTKECIEHYKENTIRMHVPLNNTDFIFPNGTLFTYENLIKFIEINSVGILTPLDEFAMNILSHFKRPVIFYFKQNIEGEDKIINALKQAESKHKEKYVFLVIDPKSEEDIHTDFTDLFEITEEELPRFQIVKFKDFFYSYDNYCMNQEIAGNLTEKLIEGFITDYEDGELFKEPLSERIPIEGDMSEGFDRIVSKTFYKKVVFSNVTYMMLFVNDKCEEEDEKCIELVELWRLLGRKYFKNTEARFGYINFSHNEIYQFNIIERYPSIYLYLKDNKHDPIEYEGEWKKEDIEKWLAKWIGWETVPEDPPELNEEDDDDDDENVEVIEHEEIIEIETEQNMEKGDL